MRAILSTLTAAAALALPGGASAGPFGGFAADESTYLVGTGTVCTPIAISAAKSQATPRCEAADQRRIAAGKYRRGKLQAGVKARYEARARGTALTVTDREAGRAVVEWSTLDPFGRVTGVHLSEGGRVLAVEYEVRVGGRVSARVIAFALPDTRAAAAPGPATPTETPGAPGPTTPAGAPAGTSAAGDAAAPPADPALAKALDRARRAHKGAPRAALAAWRAVLAADPDHAEARYGEAVGLARQNKAADALAALEALARSPRGDAVVWRVEARFDPAFRKLRADRRFRAAVGLDGAGAGAGAGQTLYERLLGFSGTWEQHAVPCEQAEVRLDMDRLARTFKLRIRTRCGGFDDTTRLGGKFSLHGADEVRLVMPNKGGADEVVACRLRPCGDAGGEQCLQCVLDADLQFTLRVVRR